MASIYYTPPPQVIDGDVAFAADVNDINNECNSAFILVEAAIDQATVDAAAFAAKAKEWAEGPGEPPDYTVEVEPGLFSSKKYSVDSSDSASNALNSENAAAISESNAATSEANAGTSASNAATSESSAASSASGASTSASNAATSESNAASSASAALASESNAALSESNASTSESNAASSASAASISESNAATSASNAGTSASNAALSESNAASSAGSASISAGNASTSASNAASSASSALTSENKAEQWANEDEDVEVEPGLFSGKHWAAKAEDNASNTVYGAQPISIEQSSDTLNTTHPGYANDADNITYPGYWPVASSDANLPIAQTGFIHVEHSQLADRVRQTYKNINSASASGNVEYVRSSNDNGGTWDSWGRIEATTFQLSSRTTTGSWSITGVQIGRPLYIISDASGGSSPARAYLSTTSGGVGGRNLDTWVGQSVGSNSVNSQSLLIMPTSTTVVISVSSVNNDFRVYAYQ